MPDPNTIPFREADGNGHYRSKQLPQDRDEFLDALGLPTFAGDVVTASGSGTAGGEVTTFWGTDGHTIKAANQTGLAKLTSGVISSVAAPTGAVVGTTDVQTLTNKTLDNAVHTGTVTGIDKFDVGLGNVDNTSDANKPPPASVTAALTAKEDKTNKGITNGYASLDTIGKVPLSQIPDAIIGASRYQGTWNAATNSPAIPAAAPANNGYYYSVAVGGSTNIDGISAWAVGDTIISNGSIWQKIPVANAVQSVNAKTGIVVLNKNDIGLGNVDNTSDATKNSAAVALTNKTIDGSANALNVRLNTADVSGSLPVTNLDGGTGASATTFWRGDGHWVSPTGAGDVQGPGSATDGGVALFNGASGKQLKVFGGAAGFAKLTTVGVVSTQTQMQAGDISAAMISGQTEKTALVDPDDMFLEVDKATGLLRFIRAKWFSRLPRNYLSGGILKNNAVDAVNDIDVSAGVCRDDTDSGDIKISAFTKQLDVAWAAGTNAGGRDTGAIANVWWHVFAINNPTSGANDVLFSQSATAPTMPSGFVYKRRIGSVYRNPTNSSIVPFVQFGDYVMWNPHIVVFNATLGATPSTMGVFVPLLAKSMQAHLRATVQCTGGWGQLRLQTTGYNLGDQGPWLFGSIANVPGGWTGPMWTGTDGAVIASVPAVQSGTATVTVWGLGYWDPREKDA